ncbi:hypothetical protein TW81_00775 [Vibrio galatheae]|uniref:Uncharacterized protein n=1 Tax=Vibrio galatheae TaxID=579748 RepID=A0A0F4NQN5_9VIBR|nr:hypothetical protein [Vibrio galatheae]KJY85168.1 hypothetical protein TW81_00775 [Vibrio galatheae]
MDSYISALRQSINISNLKQLLSLIPLKGIVLSLTLITTSFQSNAEQDLTKNYSENLALLIATTSATHTVLEFTSTPLERYQEKTQKCINANVDTHTELTSEQLAYSCAAYNEAKIILKNITDIMEMVSGQQAICAKFTEDKKQIIQNFEQYGSNGYQRWAMRNATSRDTNVFEYYDSPTISMHVIQIVNRLIDEKADQDIEATLNHINNYLVSKNLGVSQPTKETIGGYSVNGIAQYGYFLQDLDYQAYPDRPLLTKDQLEQRVTKLFSSLRQLSRCLNNYVNVTENLRASAKETGADLSRHGLDASQFMSLLPYRGTTLDQ